MFKVNTTGTFVVVFHWSFNSKCDRWL